MKFGNIFEAYGHLKDKKREVKNAEQVQEFNGIDPAVFKTFFELQVKLEKEGAAMGGGMDYHAYARRMWTDLVGPIDENSETSFKQFEDALISGLHDIDMRPNVYEHVTENMVALIRQYQDRIKNTAIWSTGDVESTAYQVGKIESSEIVKSYHRALKDATSKEETKDIIKEKTSYLVADEKFQALAQYVEGVFTKNSEEKVKIVIVEDSRGNFKKVEDTLAKVFGERASQIEVVPIWVTYSREGKQAEEKAAASDEARDALAQEKVKLNAVDSFAELLDESRFGDKFEGAHVFVDFDGVVGNNIKMRDEQARVTYNALMSAATKLTGKKEEELLGTIKSKISNSSK